MAKSTGTKTGSRATSTKRDASSCSGSTNLDTDPNFTYSVLAENCGTACKGGDTNQEQPCKRRRRGVQSILQHHFLDDVSEYDNSIQHGSIDGMEKHSSDESGRHKSDDEFIKADDNNGDDGSEFEASEEGSNDDEDSRKGYHVHDLDLMHDNAEAQTNDRAAPTPVPQADHIDWSVKETGDDAGIIYSQGCTVMNSRTYQIVAHVLNASPDLAYLLRGNKATVLFKDSTFICDNMKIAFVQTKRLVRLFRLQSVEKERARLYVLQRINYFFVTLALRVMVGNTMNIVKAVNEYRTHTLSGVSYDTIVFQKVRDELWNHFIAHEKPQATDTKTLKARKISNHQWMRIMFDPTRKLRGKVTTTANKYMELMVNNSPPWDAMKDEFFKYYQTRYENGKPDNKKVKERILANTALYTYGVMLIYGTRIKEERKIILPKKNPETGYYNAKDISLRSDDSYDDSNADDHSTFNSPIIALRTRPPTTIIVKSAKQKTSKLATKAKTQKKEPKVATKAKAQKTKPKVATKARYPDKKTKLNPKASPIIKKVITTKTKNPPKKMSTKKNTEKSKTTKAKNPPKETSTKQSTENSNTTPKQASSNKYLTSSKVQSVLTNTNEKLSFGKKESETEVCVGDNVRIQTNFPQKLHHMKEGRVVEVNRKHYKIRMESNTNIKCRRGEFEILD